jgi:hypothetical protein
MIVVSTDYDPVTQSLALVAAHFVASAGAANPSWPSQNLVPRNSPSLPDRAEVDQALNAHPGAALVFFGHGYDSSAPMPGFHGQDQLPALDPASASILQNRVVVAVCCHSLNAMATAALAHGATVLGYDDALAVLLPMVPGVDAAIRNCLSTGLSVLVQGQTVTDARDATRVAFSVLGNQLSQTGNFSAAIAAFYVQRNVQRHDFRGNGTATL